MKRILLALIAILFLLNGCEYLGSDPTPPPAPVDGLINVSIIEAYEDYNKIGYPSFYLRMFTEKDYPCFNYKILSDIKISGPEINVSVMGVSLPGNICLTALGPATSLDKLSLSEGDYKLIINDNQVISAYNVSVTKSYISFDKTASGSTIVKSKLRWRYPDNSFVYMCGTLTQDSVICNDFLDTVKSKISLSEFTFPDSGAIPYASVSQGHYYDMPAKYFLYQSGSRSSMRKDPYF